MKQTKTRAFSWLLMLVMAFSLISPGMVKQVQAEGKTTLAPNAEGTYELGSADDFLAFATKVNAGEKNLNAVLTNDIDMKDKTWIPIVEYAGIFDGQNHKIENLTFESTDKDQGIFGTNTGTIENIADITGTYTGNHMNIGGLTANNKGKVVNCHSSVKITCNKNGGYVGGVVGYNITDTALVEKCSFGGTITVPADSTVSGAYIGGIIGRQRTGKPYIIGCVNRGTITVENSKWMYIGGIAGYADGGDIWFSYNEGILQAASKETYISGIAYSAKPYNCYSVGTLTGGKSYPISPVSGMNNYYLSDDKEQGARTDEEFKKNSMVSELNAFTTSMKSLVPADCVFEQSNGFPTLVWEGKGIKVTSVAVQSAAISGNALSGATLTAVITGENDAEPTSVSYQWQVSNEEGYEDIADAVYSTFSLPDTETYVGKQLRVVVTGGNDSKITSEPTAVIGKSDKLRVTEDKTELQAFTSPILEDCQLALPTKGSNDSTITWESNKPGVISNEGKVVLPTKDKESVSIKATISYNDTTATRSFSVQVQSVDYQQAQADSKELKFESTKLYEAQTLALPTKGKNGSTITWTSNKTDCITNEGVVTLPATGTQSVTLKATITKNDTIVTNSFWMTVYSTDKGNVTRDKDELSIQTDVRESGIIELPTQGKHGSAITWTSNTEDVIANDGTVTLPESGVVSVTLKATLVFNEVKDTKSFLVKVCSEDSQTKQLNVTFTLIGDDVHGTNPHKAFYKWIDGYKATYVEADQKTALDLIDDAFNEYGFQRVGSNSYVSGVITPDGITLAQMMNGSGSGWMYKVNGESPNFGMSGYKLADGDNVEFYYVHSYQDAAAEPITTPVQTITLDKKEVSLSVGQKRKLTADVKPTFAANTAVSWTSSDSNIVEISDKGIITAKAVGTAVVTVKAADGNGATAQCNITVTGKEDKKDDTEESSKLEYSAVKTKTLTYLKHAVSNPVVSSVGGEWSVLSLARGGVKDVAWYRSYYQEVEKQVENKGNKLSETRSTENSRVIIGLTSIGANPADIEGYNLLVPLADFDYVVQQGLNGAVYALIAVDSGKYEIPQVDGVENQTTRESLIAYILNRQTADGGWGYSDPATDPNATSDIDMTAMTIQALAPYYNADKNVKKAVKKAISLLSGLQGEDGLYTSVFEWDGVTYTNTSSESCSQVICALASLGIDADTDSRFIKNGTSLLDALLSYYDKVSGGFKHSQEDTEVPNLMATEQAAYTLAAYDRLQNGQSGLYEMSDAVCLYECPKNGHDWDGGKITKTATEQATGIKTYTCKACGETKEEVIPKLEPKPATTEQATTTAPTTEVPTTQHEVALEKPTGNTIKSTKKKQLKITLKARNDISGYQIQVSTSSKFKNAKIYKVKNANIGSKTIKGLKSKKKYYVRIRTYNQFMENNQKVTIYSKWSKAKKLKVR